MKYKRTIILLADGARFDTIEDLISQNRLKNIKRLLIDQGSFLRAVTAFPSTTGPAHIPYLTGCLPATCNVPGIRWFDKKKYGRYGHGSPLSLLSFGARGRYRSYVGMETFRINTDMRNDIYTIFELLPKSYSIFNSVNRGVGCRNLTKIMRIWYWYYGHLTDRWHFVDNAGYEKILKVLKKDFEFLFAVLPGIDEYSHLDHFKSEYTLKQYDCLDEFVGQMIAELAKNNTLDDTVIWIVSDHGLTKTHTHFCLNTFLEGRGIKTFYYPLIHRRDCIAASMVSGNGMAHLYFKKEEGWSEPATAEDIDEMYPGIIDELLLQEAIDIVAMKDSDGKILVKSRRGVARLSLFGNQLSYDLLEGDPFGYNLGSVEVRDNERALLEATIDSDYPDALYQLAHIFLSPRCGDVVVSATPGYDLRLKYEHPEHKGTHGSLHREHMVIPVISNVKIDTDCLRTVDVFPTYLRLMGRNIPDNIDGKPLI